MAAFGDGPCRTSDVAKAMRRPASAISGSRSALIDLGLIYAPEYGQVAFTVPGMADFIRRHTDDAAADDGGAGDGELGCEE